MAAGITLRISNFPASFQCSDVTAFLSHFGIEASVHNKRRAVCAFATIGSEAEARKLISRLHQLQILNARLRLEYYDGKATDPSEPKTSVEQHPGDTSHNDTFRRPETYNIEQLPPPFLRYKYPKPSAQTIRVICETLWQNTAFYNQVLHLMNRLNIPPPFDDGNFRLVDASQQTERVSHRFSDSESELESETEVSRHPKRNGKHKATIRIIQQSTPSTGSPTLERHRSQPTSAFAKKIKVNIPATLASDRESERRDDAEGTGLQRAEKTPTDPPALEVTQVAESAGDAARGVANTLTEAELLQNRIPDAQQQTLHIFQNYQPGTASNKLYIKNLSKHTTEEDLQRIYYLFASGNQPEREVTIKLLKTGRMKGQAFVTFSAPDDAAGVQQTIAAALRMTNGYILNDKPMVVVYAKGEQSTKGPP